MGGGVGSVDGEGDEVEVGGVGSNDCEGSGGSGFSLQVEVWLYWKEHSYPGSTIQDEEHPSPFRLLLSSQASELVLCPSLHSSSWQTEGWSCPGLPHSCPCKGTHETLHPVDGAPLNTPLSQISAPSLIPLPQLELDLSGAYSKNAMFE